MASRNYVLEQRKEIVKTQLNTLINNDLKEICKAYGYQVSGVKPILQKRCKEILEFIFQKGEALFSEFEYRVNNHGRPPPDGVSATSSRESGQMNGSYRQTSPTRIRTMTDSHRSLSTAGKSFKASPFYEILDTVLPAHDLPEMPQNRHTVNARLALNAVQVQRLRDDGDIRLLLYCGLSSSLTQHLPTDITFPSQLEVKINSDDFKHSYKGLKNKAGSTKPADITDKIRKNIGYQNQISVTYALTKERFSFTVYMARHINANKLIERIRTGRVIPKQTVIDEMNQANADPEIAATSVRMSLKDPISCCRINVPVRSTVCTHNQCFDGAMFLQLQEQAPQWNCPVCNKNVPFESLCIDKYFEDILQRTSSSIDKVDIEPNGEWNVIKEEEESQASGPSRKRPRASYDDDFDDDEPVEVAEADAHTVNGNYSNVRPLSSASFAAPGMSFYTPPIPSRETSVAQSATSAQRPSSRRAANTVIDLTLSEDDEPPRPAKRQSTNTNQSRSSLPLHPPPLPIHSPMSDHRNTNPHHQTGHDDIYRASNSAEGAPTTGRSSSTANRGHYSIINGDPVRQGHSSSPTSFARRPGSAQAFTSQPQSTSTPERNDIPTFSGFTLRSPDRALQQLQHPSNNGLRLPSMQQLEQNGFHDGWRNSNYGNYSSSPSS